MHRTSPTRSSAATKCISDVPGLAKHTSTPAPANVLTKLAAPFICSLLPYASVERDARRILASTKQPRRQVWALPFSSAPTQVGATAGVLFRATVMQHGDAQGHLSPRRTA